MDDLSQLSDEELMAEIQSFQPQSKTQTTSSSNKSVRDLSDDELLSEIQSIAPELLKQPEKGTPLPKDTKVVDAYSNEKPKFMDSLASAAGAFSRGIEGTPAKINYDVMSTIDGIAHSIGILNDEEYERNIEGYRQGLVNSIDESDPDVQNFPNLAKNTQTVGALGAEMAATAPIKGLQIAGSANPVAGIFNAASRGATQGAAIGALQGAPGEKGQNATIAALFAGPTAAVGATTSAAANAAVDGMSKLAKATANSVKNGGIWTPMALQKIWPVASKSSTFQSLLTKLGSLPENSKQAIKIANQLQELTTQTARALGSQLGTSPQDTQNSPEGY